MLNANGFVLTFEPTPRSVTPRIEPDYIQGKLSLRCTVPGIDQTFESDLYCPLSDLTRLCDYVDQHIEALLVEAQRSPSDWSWSTPQSSPLTWLDVDINAFISFLTGNVTRDRESIEGYFSIQVQLYVGNDPTSGSSVYGGYEGSVTVGEITRFQAELRTLVETRDNERSVEGCLRD
jgi:hypothetical protein